jgi:hypothetical protein
MTDPGASQPSAVSGAGPLDYPTNHVFGAVDPQQLSALVPALIDAGFAPIGILAGEAGLHRLQQTAGGSGLGGLLRRIQMSVGGDLDYVAQAQEALKQGRALVDVEVDGDAAKDRARDVFLQHGGERIVYFSAWTIETLT